MKTLTTS